MSIISYASSPRETKTSDELSIIGEKVSAPKKALEEEEYLGRMAKIIRRDFFPDTQFVSDCHNDSTTSYRATDRSTPGTSRTQFSTTSSTRSRQEASSMGLDDFLEKYTSEDNAYFEKMQQKELRRHRLKYPWIYGDKNEHNKRVQEQLKLPSIREQASSSGPTQTATKMIDWPHNPKNSLFYAPDDVDAAKRRPSTINYRSNLYTHEPIFKEPLPPSRSGIGTKSYNRFSDKIGIDGKLVNGAETPIINGYSFIPAPETPRAIVDEPKSKIDTNRFYIPNESPKDELAHRLYMEKVAKSIRTPRSDTSRANSKTPSSRRSLASFSFSPERVKTPKMRHKK